MKQMKKVVKVSKAIRAEECGVAEGMGQGQETQILIDVAPYTTLGIEPRTYSRTCMGKLVTILLSASVG